MLRSSIANMLLLFLLFAGQTPARAGESITVSAALSLKAVFEELGREYEQSTGSRVQFNFAASGVLQKQIENGAPVDVFASASPKETAALEQQDLLVPGTRTVFASNDMVLIAPAKAGGPADFADLASGRVLRIAIGNPRTVPAGRYAEEVLHHYSLWEKVQQKLVLAENVRQVLDYVSRGEVEAGILFATDAAVRSNEVAVVRTAPAGSHEPALYEIAVVKGTARERDARDFIAFVLSRKGQGLLKGYGFSVAKPGAY